MITYIVAAIMYFVLIATAYAIARYADATFGTSITETVHRQIRAVRRFISDFTS